VNAASPSACARKVRDAGGSTPDIRTMNGMEFFHAAENEGSASHFIETDLLGTYSRAKCYLFEHAFDYNDIEGPPGYRTLSDTDKKMLRHELDMVMQSVIIDDTH
jgi:hypothetical protein